MIIVGLSGKKQSGKDTVAKFLARNAVRLWPKQGNDFTKVETLYFGGPMKQFAEGFGVPRELLWGSDEDKNNSIHIHWEQLPHYEKLRRQAVVKSRHDALCRVSGQDILAHGGLEKAISFLLEKEKPPQGPMTVRQFLQQIGEEMFLEMDPQYWVKQFEKSVKESKVDVVLVPDPRKPEQIACLKRLGAITFRLTRDPYKGSDTHISEVALDRDKFDWGNFSAVIDNEKMTVEDTNWAVFEHLRRAGVIGADVDPKWVEWGD